MTFLDEMIQQAVAAAPAEICGLVVSHGSKCRLIQAKNLSDDPTNSFELDPLAWLKVVEGDEVIGIYHSHPKGTAHPSMADLTSCEASGVPWHIVTLEGNYTCTQPSGFLAPYLGRPYVYGIHDCYAVVRDWYGREWGLELPDFERVDNWWDHGQNLFVDRFEECGFRVVSEQTLCVGDTFLIQICSPVPSHVAVYVGDGMILHHVRNRLSGKDPFGGMWERHRTHHLRHVSRMEDCRG